MRGKPKAYWRDVFRVWEREILKADFAIQHAAKALRLLPKVNFTGMPRRHPVLLKLLNRTKAAVGCLFQASRGLPGARELPLESRLAFSLSNQNQAKGVASREVPWWSRIRSSLEEGDAIASASAPRTRRECDSHASPGARHALGLRIQAATRLRQPIPALERQIVPLLQHKVLK